MTVSRVTLVGLDGASLPLIQAWAERGQLPGFSRLFKEGGWGGLRSTVPPISPSAWTSIFTGVTPGKHGIFGFVKRRQNSYFPRPIGGMDIQAPPLWRLLSEKGVRSAWVHIPFVYPPEPINGVMITGLGTPSINSDFVYPTEKKTQIQREYPDFDVDFNEDQIELSHNLSRSLPKIKKVTSASISLFMDLRKDRSFRLVAGVFRALDVVQHYKINDPEALLPFYQEFDRLIEHCIQSKTPDEVVIVCSDHGFRDVRRHFHINNWLERLELLRMRKKPTLAKIGLKAESFQKILIHLRLKDLVWRIKRSSISEKVLQFLPSDDFSSGIDWATTKAYYIGNEGGTIYLNLANREPNGVVKKGPESETTVARIIKSAQEIKDPATGESVVSQVLETGALYGRCPSDAPDVLMVENEGYTFSGRYNYSGELFSEVDSRHGDHSMEGILFMDGSHVAPKQIRNASVWDIAPTILYLLGITIPGHFDGRVLEEAFIELSPVTMEGPPVRSSELDRISRKIQQLKESGKI